MQELPNLKYRRWGYHPQGRPVDFYVEALVDQLPPDFVLPRYWRYVSKARFLYRWGDEGRTIWARTASYHLCLIDGDYVFRFWTDSANRALVDVSDPLAEELRAAGQLEVYTPPESTFRKTKPLYQRTEVEEPSDVISLLTAVKDLYQC